MEALCAENEDFDPSIFKFRLKNSKCGTVKPRSDMYSIIISGKISKVLVSKTPS